MNDDEYPTAIEGDNLKFKLFDEWKEENVEKIRFKGSLHVTKTAPVLRAHLKADVIRLFQQCGSLEEVCETLLLSPGTITAWRIEDPAFGKAIDMAKSEGVLSVLEERALRVALGKETMSAAQLSMLQFLLKSYGRDRFDLNSEPPTKKTVSSFKLVEAKPKDEK